MIFLVDLDHSRSGLTPTPEAGRAFIEQVIFPTLDRAERLAEEKKILAGGAVAGRISLRFIMEADSIEEIDRIVSGLPLWTVAETRVTPLITLAERRSHVEALLENLADKKAENE